MFMDPTPDGMQVIKHRATRIQHRSSKGNFLEHICNDNLMDFMYRYGKIIIYSHLTSMGHGKFVLNL